MNKYLNKKNYIGSTVAATFVVSKVVKMLVKKGYSTFTGKQPPENPEDQNATLKEIIIFSFSTALLSAAAKMITRKLIAQKWKGYGGELPSHLD